MTPRGTKQRNQPPGTGSRRSARRDPLDKKQRSYCMSQVPAKNTSLEKIVQLELRKHGIKFRTHLKTLAGRPDIVLREPRVAIFIDGDFWHGYRFSRWSSNLPRFWQNKIAQNRIRDQKNFRKLRRLGWTVIRLWQHEIKKNPVRAFDKIFAGLERRNRAGR
jgi:DNA mismatch endonuclease (patch repair protein)